VARIHEPGKLQRVLVDMLGGQPGSCRRLGAKLGLDKMTVWRWRQKLIQALEGVGETGFRGIVEADEKFFRESRKGSREWVNHRKDPVNFPKPDRPRWADFRRLRMKLPAGISKYQIGVLTVTDRSGGRRADVLPDRRATSLTSRLARHVSPDAVLCSDGDTAYGLFASEPAIPHYRLDTKNGPRVIDRAFHVQTINSLHDRFERFMQPFRGPATKNLQGYAAWFIAGLTGTPQSRIEQAWDRLLA
jgi:hypothetical protein